MNILVPLSLTFDVWYGCDKGCDSAQICGGVALTESLFGAGNGPVWLNNVSCCSSAKDLSQCNHIGWGNVTMMFSPRYNNSSWYCNHYNDNAGVICYDLETYINKTESVCPANMACWILFGTVLLILFTLTTVIAKQFKRRKAASSSVSMTTDDMTPERNTNDNRAYTVTPNEGAMDEKERQMLVRLKEIAASKVKLMQRISIYRRNKMLDKRLDKVEMDMAILKNEAISLQGRINL
ncbi:hypothetical protein ACJMK2_017657 [Sinanodonta woodiana]|uniref:SRCR domain-containing protein n=1 Tax=Sinanodonta woodiana TaxID=1069815 RepID=A0ABD3UB00_SINWO